MKKITRTGINVVIFANGQVSDNKFHRMPFYKSLARQVAICDGKILIVSHYFSILSDIILNPFGSARSSHANSVTRLDKNLFLFTPRILGNLLLNQMCPPIKRIFAKQIRPQLLDAMSQAGFHSGDPLVLLVSHPYHFDYIKLIDAASIVYDCYDDFSLFGRRVRNSLTFDKEARLARNSDLILASSCVLLNRMKSYNENSYLFNSAINREAVDDSVMESRLIPEDFANIKHPVIGFAGCLKASDDIDLLKQMVTLKPMWSFVFLGEIAECMKQRFNSLCTLPNVSYLGIKSENDYIKHISAFDVGIMPFKVTDLTRTFSPYKMYDYIGAGVPIVSTPIPEVLRYGNIIEIAYNAETFIMAIENSLLKDRYLLKTRYREIIKTENWEMRSAFAMDLFQHILTGKRPQKNEYSIN